MKINACLIVKGDEEEQILRRCLASFIEYVDGVYLTVTSKPCPKIEALTNEINKAANEEVIHLSYFKWVDDFAAARNFNFSQAPQDSDYLFWVDSDDIVVHGENLRVVADLGIKRKQDAILVPYWYGCTFKGEPSIENLVSVDIEQKMRERFLRPGVHRWTGRLHETPIPNSGVKNDYFLYEDEDKPFQIMHGSNIEEAYKKLPRNRTLLELQLKDERQRKEGADPRTLLYLMKIYSETSDDPKILEETIKMGQEYLAKSGWDEERGTAYENMGMAAGMLGRHQEAISYFFKSIEEWPHQPIVYLRLATAYYNIGNYRLAYFWMNKANEIDTKEVKSSMLNVEGMKIMSTELLMRLNFRDDFKDTKVAREAAEQLYKLKPNEQTQGMLHVIADADDLNEACKNTDQLSKYLVSIGEESKVTRLLDELPQGITAQPFAQQLRMQYSEPRVWDKNEICIFANFYQNHFEQWSPKSLETGIGGSETAVIELAKRWAAMGYKVTVYGDPRQDQGEFDGVTYLPWYYFNHRDSFNIFIQWRSWYLADKIKTKLFLSDLHDIYSQVDITPDIAHAVDKFMVKSEYHRQLGQSVPDDKFEIIPNGI